MNTYISRKIYNLKAAASASDLQNPIILIDLIDFTDSHVFHILFIDFDEISVFLWVELVSRHTCTTRCRDSLSSPFFKLSSSRFRLENLKINTSADTSTFIRGLGETVWGKISVMTVGSFHLFIKVMTSTCVLQIKAIMSPKTSILVFSI